MRLFDESSEALDEQTAEILRAGQMVVLQKGAFCRVHHMVESPTLTRTLIVHHIVEKPTPSKPSPSPSP